MKEIIRTISECDFTPESILRYQEALITGLGNLPIIQIKIDKGRAVYRCRKHTLPFNLFTNESEISYRTDIEKIQSYGRCNTVNSSKFYGSMVSSEIKDGFVTSIFETSALMNEDKDGHEIYTIGMWKAKEDFYIPVIPSFGKNSKENLLTKELNSWYDNIPSEYIDFYKKIGNEFSKKVDWDNNDLYGISAITSEILLKKSDGIAYTSVKANQKSFNVAFNPETFDDKFSLYRVGVGDLLSFNKKAEYRHLYISEVTKGESFKFINVPNKAYRSLDSIIENYEREGVSKKYIISKINHFFSRLEN